MNCTLQMLGAAALAAVCGCAPFVRSTAQNASRVAVPVVIDETLKGLEDPHTRDRIALIMATPQVQAAMGELASGFTRGALDDPETIATIERLTAALARTLMEVVRAELVKMSPQIRLAVRRAVIETVAAATREATLTLAEDVPSRLAPAVRSAVTTQLEEPELRHALALTGKDVAKEIVLGSREAMVENNGPKGGVVNRASQFLGVATWGILLAMSAAAFGMAVWFRRTRRKPRRRDDLAYPLTRRRLLRHPPTERAWHRAVR